MLREKNIYLLLIIAVFTILAFINNSFYNDYLIKEISSYNLQNFISWQSIIKSEVFFGYNFTAPHITLLVSKIIYSSFGNQFYVLIFQILLPSLTIYFIALIYSKYLTLRFSIILAIISCIFYSNFPLREFLINFINGNQLFIEGSQLEILSNPIPSFSTIYFVIIFYFSQKINSISLKQIILFNLLFSSIFFVHPLDALYGCGFWIVFSSIKIIRSKDISYNSKYFYLILNIIYFLTIVFLYYTLFKEENSFYSNNPLLSFNYYTFFSYIILPLIFSIFIFLLFKVDIFEILFRYWHIFIILLVEAFLLVILFFFPVSGADTNLIDYRINQFLFHFYYFIPALNVISRNSYFPPNFRTENLMKIIYILKKIIFHIPKVFILFLIILITQISLNTNNKLHKKNIITGVDKQFINFSNSDKLLFTDDFIYMMNIIGNKSLKSNTFFLPVFFNKKKYENMLDFFFLFSLLNNWSEEDLLIFFSPGTIYNKNIILAYNSKKEITASGIGYYSIFNNQIINDQELLKFQKTITRKYKDKNISMLIKKYKIEKIFLSKKNIMIFEEIKNIKDLDIEFYE